MKFVDRPYQSKRELPLPEDHIRLLTKHYGDDFRWSLGRFCFEINEGLTKFHFVKQRFIFWSLCFLDTKRARHDYRKLTEVLDGVLSGESSAEVHSKLMHPKNPDPSVLDE